MAWTSFLTQAITLLTGGITGVASALGSGLSTLVQDLAVTGTGESATMSAFMSVVLIFGGISLAIGLGRWVVNLLTSLGQRNR